MREVSFDLLPEEGIAHDARIRKRVALRNGDVPHLTQFARAVFKPGQVARAHAHAGMWEIFLCRAGRGCITIDSRAVPLRPGVLVVVEPGEVHELENDGDGDLLVDVVGIAD